MTKKVIAAIFLTVVLFFSLIFTIPIVLLSEGFATYDKINENKSYYYSPNNSSNTKILNLEVDRSDVEIKYVYPPKDFVVKIDTHFEISGKDALRKSYLDYFEILWENGSSHLNFKMKYKSGIDPFEVTSLFKNISIVVSLRADVMIDLNIEIDHGKFQQIVPFKVPINNVKINNTNGDILLNFTSCVISGTITALSNRGNIDLNAYNAQYTQDNHWMLNSNLGDIDFFITYENNSGEMGANITGTIVTTTGHIRTVYRDANSDIGAIFTFYNTSTDPGDREGFERIINHDPLFMRYISNDSPASFNYNISLFKPLNVGTYYYSFVNN